jgi:hypothetical protein
VFCIVASTGAVSDAAQDTDPLARRRAAVVVARARVDSVHALKAIADARRSEDPVVRTYAGVEVRADTSVIPASFLAALDTAFARSHADARRVLGPAADRLLAGVRLTVARGRPAAPGPFSAEEIALRIDGRLGNGYLVQHARRPRLEEMTAYLSKWFASAAGSALPPATRAWVHGQVSLAESSVGADDVTYVRMNRHSSRVGRLCVDGSLAACRSALALVTFDTLVAWYGPPPAGAERAWAWRIRRAGSPTHVAERRTVLRRALERGGPAAFARLTADSSAPPVALERAAGMALDSVIAEWRADVIAAGRKSPAPTPAEVASLLALSVATIGVAALRRRP